MLKFWEKLVEGRRTWLVTVRGVHGSVVSSNSFCRPAGISAVVLPAERDERFFFNLKVATN